MSKEKNFETKLELSKEILEKLKDPEITLDKAMKLYKEGKSQLEEATKMLETAKLEFEELNKGDT